MIFRASLAALSVTALVACQPAVPDSGSGVGFGTYSDYQAQREAELIAAGEGRAPGATAGLDGQAVSGESVAGGTQVPTTTTPLASSVENAAGISAENDFGAVSNERSIEEDAALVAANRQQYQQVEPTALPSRPSGTQPNLVEFALATTNNVGQPIYSRLIPGAAARQARNCAKYASPDLAQLDFLASGGPERNAKGLDADGDGFACRWDPRPFRLASQAN